MGLLKVLNNIRHVAMTSVTKGIGKSSNQPKKPNSKAIEIKKILIVRPNHKLGNQLLLTPLVQELEHIFPESDIDIFAKGGIANIVFQNYASVKKIYRLPRKPFSHLLQYAWCWASIRKKRYDLVINGDKDSSSGRLLTKLSRASFKIFGDVPETVKIAHSDYEHISKYPIYTLRWYLGQIGYRKNFGMLPVLNLKLTEKERDTGKVILSDLVKNDKPTISIYTNATGDKCYSEAWWGKLYEKLLETYGKHYNVIEVLPVENISKIHFRAPHFYSKDIREMGGLIANTAIFITADNGIMHLASASLTPTLGFFKTTNLCIYGPYGNNSIALNTNATTLVDWISAVDKALV